MSSSPKGWSNEKFVRERCDWDEFEHWAEFVADAEEQSRGGRQGRPACRREASAAAARLYATGGNGAIYYGLGVTEHSQGSTTVMGIANLAMATGNIGRPGVGVNPLRGQNNVQGSCDMGSFPHELSGLPAYFDRRRPRDVRGRLGRDARQGAGPAHPQHARCRRRWHLQGHLHPGRGHPPVRSRHQACRRRSCRQWNASSCRICFSTRPRITRTSSCRVRRSWKRTAPSSTPSAASNSSVR